MGISTKIKQTAIFAVGLVMGMTISGAAVAQLGPVGTCPSTEAGDCLDPNYVEDACGLSEYRDNAGDPTWICAQVCPVVRLADCSDRSYRGSVCGRLEWAHNFGTPGWICDAVVQSELGSLPVVDTVFPRQVSHLTGQVDYGPADQVLAGQGINNGSSNRRMARYDPTFSYPATRVSGRVRYAANGSRLESCAEVAYESLWDYAAWSEQYQTEQALPEVALDAAFASLLQETSGQWRSQMQDTAQRALPQPSFHSRNPNALAVWNRNTSQAKTYHEHRFYPTLNWHAQMKGIAQTEGWSVDYLEALQAEQDRLAYLVGQWAMQMRWVVGELIREEAVLHDERAEDARRRIAQGFGVDDFAALVWTSEVLAARTGPLARRRAETHQWLAPQELVSAQSGTDYWSPDDTIPIKKYYAYVPPKDRYGINDPDLGLTYGPPDTLDLDGQSFTISKTSGLADRFVSTAHAAVRPGSRFEEVLASLMQNAQQIESEINRLYDELEPICSQSPSPCAWAPSVFLTDFSGFYDARRDGVHRACLGLTGNVFDPTSLYQAAFMNPEVPASYDPAGGSAQYNIDYGQDLLTLERLGANKAAYKLLAQQYLDFLKKEIVGDLLESLTIDPATGRPTLVTHNSQEHTVGGGMFGVSSRAVEASGAKADRQVNSYAGGFCEPAPEFQGDYDVAVQLIGHRMTLAVARNDVSLIQIAGTPKYSYSMQTEVLGVVLPVLGVKADAGIGEFTLGASAPEIKNLSFLPPISGLAPFTVFGIPVRWYLGVVGGVSGDFRATFVLGSGANACQAGFERRWSVTTSAGLRVEGYVAVALDAVIVEAGIRGSVSLHDYAGVLSVSSRFVPGDIGAQSQGYKIKHKCDNDTGVWHCKDPIGNKLVELDTDANILFISNGFGGRISLFARLKLPPINPTLELDLVRAHTGGKVYGTRTWSKAEINPEFWCNPLLFGDLQCTY